MGWAIDLVGLSVGPGPITRPSHCLHAYSPARGSSGGGYLGFQAATSPGPWNEVAASIDKHDLRSSSVVIVSIYIAQVVES
uniref:Uncharacterized protein n=1 Tax=Oryza glumipatula TaxID=40148 RepID=A0A0D9YB59_9ORYZ